MEEKGDGELEAERGELGLGVSARDRCVDTEPFVPLDTLTTLLTLSLRDQNPLLCAIPAVAEDMAGVTVPGVPGNVLAVVRCKASAAARNSKLVVPSAFVLPDLAEHTIAILCWSR